MVVLPPAGATLIVGVLYGGAVVSLVVAGCQALANVPLGQRVEIVLPIFLLLLGMSGLVSILRHRSDETLLIGMLCTSLDAVVEGASPEPIWRAYSIAAHQ